MKSIFSGYYNLSESELADIWQECTFIIDTNILLNLYRYPRSSSNELLGILKKIADRLWIPFQVALEYQENRLIVINEQIEIFHKVKKTLSESRDNLEQGLGQLQLRKRHSLIDPSEFLNKVNAAFEEFQQELEHLKKHQPNIFTNDKIRDEIDIIINGRIGSFPQSQDWLDAIYKEGEKRYTQQHPPGYMDIGKEKELIKKGEKIAYLYNGLTFERKYGDLILWYQIIEEAKINEKLKKIIFISGDVKEDWWYKIDRFGSREKAIISPRPELVQELAIKAGVLVFHMYQTDSFIHDANKYLGTQVSEETVAQIRDVNIVAAQPPAKRGNIPIWFNRVLEPAIYEWLVAIHQPNKFNRNNRFHDFPDYIAIDEQGLTIGYELKFTGRGGFNSSTLISLISKGKREISEGNLNILKIIIVTDTENTVPLLRKSIDKTQFPSNIAVEIVLLTYGEYDKLIFTKVT